MWYENNFSHTQTQVSAKSIQRYWLLEVMVEETKRIELPLNNYFYNVLLRHCGKRLYSGISTLDEKTKKAVFQITTNLIKTYKPETPNSLTFFEKQLEKSIISQDISYWEFVCNYI